MKASFILQLALGTGTIDYVPQLSINAGQHTRWLFDEPCS